MSTSIRILLATSALILTSLACSTLVGKSPNETTATEPPTNTAPITEAPATETPVTATPVVTEAPLTCPAITDQIIKIATAEGESEGDILDEEVYLVTYTVSGDELSDPYYENVDADLQDEQNNTAVQQQVWDYFTALIPLEQREVIREYSIVTDGRDGSLAAVTQTQDDPSLWALEVDTADSNDIYSLTFTLIHEFGHLLTLGPNQVPPNLAVFNNPDDNQLYLKEASKCPQYFPGEGCANPDSYINAYFEQFWADIHEEWNDINLEENEDAYYARLDEFYYKYEDQFVTSYAATSPEEDIAETWSFFVLAPQPAGDTIAEEKILFFYQYPELVQLREQILKNLCRSFPK